MPWTLKCIMFPFWSFVSAVCFRQVTPLEVKRTCIAFLGISDMIHAALQTFWIPVTLHRSKTPIDGNSRPDLSAKTRIKSLNFGRLWLALRHISSLFFCLVNRISEDFSSWMSIPDILLGTPLPDSTRGLNNALHWLIDSSHANLRYPQKSKL